jgi:hypothetical protein
VYVLEKKSVKNCSALTCRALIASLFHLNEATPIGAADIHSFPESVNCLTSCLKVAIGMQRSGVSWTTLAILRKARRDLAKEYVSLSSQDIRPRSKQLSFKPGRRRPIWGAYTQDLGLDQPLYSLFLDAGVSSVFLLLTVRRSFFIAIVWMRYCICGRVFPPVAVLLVVLVRAIVKVVS